MPNSYPEWRNFQFAPNNHYGFFFLHTCHSTIAFGLEYVLFYQTYAEITTFFRSRYVRFGSYLRCWSRNVWRKNWRQHDEMTSKRQNSYPDAMHESRLIPLPPPPHTHTCKTTFPNPGRIHGNSGRICNNTQFEPWPICRLTPAVGVSPFQTTFTSHAPDTASDNAVWTVPKIPQLMPEKMRLKTSYKSLNFEVP